MLDVSACLALREMRLFCLPTSLTAPLTMEGLTSLLLGASVALIVYHVANAIRPRRKQVVESPVPAVRCTLRVREIRSSVSREALLRSLLEIGKHDAQDGPSPQVESHIVRWSFTRSAHVRHAASSFVATVCLSQLSARLRKEIGLNGRSPVDIRLGIQIEGNLHRVLVDDHFHGLTPLYWHPDWGIDIVAVTGWNGKAFMSWKPENSEEMWLRDWLGDDLARQNCHARIFTYGYPSKLADSTTDATLYDYGQGLLRAIKTARYNQLQGSATRPLILIGHSLGGLLIRQAGHPEYLTCLSAKNIC
ncbi:hypothetical protein GGR56DRAFT_556109 [Xylariaceae sp. FL0804]|nr:hypothetical protein GGR56DRAFT_556109 [Xylariaceae sp. FL0804]